MKTCNVNRIKLCFLLFVFSFFSASQVDAQTKEQFKEDLNYIYDEIIKIHPEPYGTITESDFKQLKCNIENQISDQCNIETFYILAAPLVASLKDGHSLLATPITENRISYLNNDGLTFPLRLEIDSLSKLIVLANMSECDKIKVGDEIVSINNIKASDFVIKIQSLLGSENNTLKATQLNPYISLLLWYFYRFEENYELTIKQQGKEYKYHLNGIPASLAQRKMKELLPSSSEKKFDLSINENKAVLNIKSFYDTEQLSNFLYNSFKTIDSADIRYLTIDIQNNSGGRSASIDTLLYFITDNHYELYPRIDLRVSDKVKSVYKERNNPLLSVIDTIPIGNNYTYSSGIVKPKNNEYLYKGNLDVVLNEASYSASLTFASVVKALGRGRVIGYNNIPATYYGDFVFLQLPNTNLELYISTKKFRNN